LVWWGSDDDPTPGVVERHDARANRRNDPEAPSLSGVERAQAPARTEPPPVSPNLPERLVPAHTAHGQVTDEDGAPIPGASVFTLPKGMPGYRNAPSGKQAVPIAETDAGGRWRLAVSDVPGSWVVVIADGYETAHRDLPERPGNEVRIRLKRSKGIEVVVEGSNGPPPEGTRVSARSIGDPFALPGPGSPRRFYEAANVDPTIGAATLHPPLDGSVEIRASRYGFYAVPEREVLTAHQPRVTFRLLPSCILKIHVKDSATGEPLDQGFRFSVLQGGDAVQGGATTLPGGEFRVADRLRPGRHTVIVSSDGYLDSEHPNVVFRQAGEETTVNATLKRDPTLGHLRVRVPALADLPMVRHPLGGEPQPAPAFFLLRRVAPSAGAWDLAPAVHREDATTYRFSNLPSGEVDVLVGNRPSKLVAVVRSVTVPAGNTNIVTAELAEGGMLDLTGLLPAESDFKVVGMKNEHGVTLPVYAAGAGWMSVYGPGDAIDTSRTLGPYPAGATSLEVLTGKGRKKTYPLDIKSQ
jgi:hypothetical protein